MKQRLRQMLALILSLAVGAAGCRSSSKASLAKLETMDVSDDHNEIPLISDRLEGTVLIYEVPRKKPKHKRFWGVHFAGKARQDVSLDTREFILRNDDYSQVAANGKIIVEQAQKKSVSNGRKVAFAIFAVLVVVLLVAALSSRGGGGNLHPFGGGGSDDKDRTKSADAGTEVEVFLVYPVEEGVEPEDLRLIF